GRARRPDARDVPARRVPRRPGGRALRDARRHRRAPGRDRGAAPRPRAGAAMHVRRCSAARRPLLPELRPVAPADRGGRERRGRAVSAVSTPDQQRELALQASEGTCPRCGAAREPDQEYCVECGLRLPPVKGRLPAFRRWWIRRFGWYPGDWAWLSLLTLLVAVAGAAAAIAVTQHRRAGHAATILTPTLTGT